MSDKTRNHNREEFKIKRCDDHMNNYLDQDMLRDDILTNDKVTKKYLKNKKNKCGGFTFSKKPNFAKYSKERKNPCNTFDPNPVKIDDFINYYNEYVVSDDLTLTDPALSNCVVNPKPTYSGMPLDYDDPVSRINYVREVDLDDNVDLMKDKTLWDVYDQLTKGPSIHRDLCVKQPDDEGLYYSQGSALTFDVDNWKYENERPMNGGSRDGLLGGYDPMGCGYQIPVQAGQEWH